MDHLMSYKAYWTIWIDGLKQFQLTGVSTKH